MENLILSPISIGELKTVISETVSSEVNRILSLTKSPAPPQLITRKETAKLLGISLVTLNEWQKSGRIPAYRINTRIRYKHEEVLKCLIQLQTNNYGEVA